MNKHVSLAMAGILGVSLVATTSIATVSADTQTLTPKPTSNGTVTFVPNTSGISVLDPNNNEKTLDPSDNSGKENTLNNIDDGLYLPYVPNLDFSKHKVNQIQDKVFFAITQTADDGVIRPHFVQVSDARGKNANPWTLTVAVGAFTNPKDSNDKLEGAQIILRNLQDQDVANTSVNPIEGKTKLDFQQAKLMNAQSPTAKASEDEMVTKINASDDSSNSKTIERKGTHVFTAGTQDNAGTSIGLYVPKNTQSAVTYNSTMTWTLTTGPTTAGN